MMNKRFQFEGLTPSQKSAGQNEQGDFCEGNHLEGDVDMYAVVKELRGATPAR